MTDLSCPAINTAIEPQAFPMWFIPTFVVGWCCVCILLSYVAGWPKLALRFRSSQPVEGERFRFASGSMGTSTWFPVNYRSCLFLTVNDNGFLISVLFIFRLFSPPLFIPWAEVEAVTEKRLWFFHHAVISIRDYKTKIMVSGGAGRCITETYLRFSKQQRSCIALNPAHFGRRTLRDNETCSAG
jgi:hypothetical protein